MYRRELEGYPHLVSLRYINQDDRLPEKGFDDIDSPVILNPETLAKIQERKFRKEKECENNNKKKKKSTSLGAVSIFSLFRYATCTEKALVIIGCLLAVISGAAYPTIVVLIGELIDIFVYKEIYAKLSPEEIANLTFMSGQGNITDGEFLEECRTLSLAATIVGAILFLLTYVMVTFLSVTAEKQVFRIKSMFMHSVLRQDIGWFDTNQTGDFSSRVTVDLGRIREGIGEKIVICIYFISTSVLSLTCALVYGWKLTLVIMSVMPILIISQAIMSKIQASLSVSELSAYGNAGAIAEEVFSSIRTVVAFGGEQKEIERYQNNLVYAKKSGIKRGLATSVGISLVWFCMYSSYALAFWYGVKLIIDSRESGTLDYTPSTLIIVFFNVLQAAMYTGQASPYIEAFSMARGAAANIFSIISRIPVIDSSSESGARPTTFVGNIQLKNVYFNYPARSDIKILNKLSLESKAGETIALVGPSGCGKSTVIQLIQRFYDVSSGQENEYVLLDGRNITEYNIGWLRQQIGVVGQEPVLFNISIKENIRKGFPAASDVDIIKAAKSANAHDFISKLPKQYDTLVGEKGAQLSGGQKQRIAIARALVRNPKILLLDEATSALDTESESVVQNALDMAREGRTTFVVAHRLSTIRNADKIIVINKGVVEETGNHQTLMEKKGLYYQLVVTQNSENEEPEQKQENFRAEITRQFSNMSNISLESSEKTQNGHCAMLENANKDVIDEDEEAPQGRLLKLASKEWPYLITGCVCALLMGLSVPIYGIILGDVIAVLSVVDPDQINKETTWYSILFVIMAVSTGVASFLQVLMFSIAGERLTMRLRRDVFAVMVRQPIRWFDDSHNSTGALCSKLSSDAAQVQGATGSRMATVNQALSTLIASIVIGLYFNWKIGLVVLCFVPLILVSTYLESRVISGHLLREKKSTEIATNIAIEAIENIRTVTSLHQQDAFHSSYVSALLQSTKNFKRRCHIRGLTFGFAQSIPALAYAVAIFYGSILMIQEGMKFGDLFKVTESIILGTMMMGEAVSFAPNYQKAKAAALRIFKLLDMKSDVDSFSNAGLRQPSATGNLKFENVHFKYPSRPEVRVLGGLNLTVEPGQTVALVGSSGCGKSTCIQLLERFYDAQGGEVCVDGTDVQNLNVSWLRSQIGLVSQEPVLFGYSIAENIAYGDNSRQVEMAEIIDAARKANIHKFVTDLPAGYETNVGERGTQLSGGQKQRIAIARALVRKPKILLLDEATSALDTESEKVVQDALDQARIGRTCIVIAHRLSTIQNADKILVIHKGHVVEQGKHYELLAKRGLYYRLCTVQSATMQ